LKTPLRWSGVAIMLVAVIWAGLTPVPDILVGADGRTFAVRGADGRLAFHHTGGDTFATREWLAADADGRDVRDPSLGNGIACDPSGCIGKLADGRLVSHALAADALEEDCERAVLIVTARDTPPGCAATVVGRDLWRTRGALTLRRNGSGFVMEAARPPNYDRLWAPAPLPPRSAPASQASGAVTAPEVAQPPPRDATPPAEALDPNE
jgi:competence protein ComEC